MEITKKRLRQIIREEVQFVAKEGEEFSADDLLNVLIDDPRTQARIDMTNEASEIQSFLEAAILALDKQSDLLDYTTGGTGMHELETAVRNILQKIQKKQLEVPDSLDDTDDDT